MDLNAAAAPAFRTPPHIDATVVVRILAADVGATDGRGDDVQPRSRRTSPAAKADIMCGLFRTVGMRHP
jgi:hypothetical protein